MDASVVAIRVALIFSLVNPGTSTCLVGCSCTDDNLERSLLCMGTSMGKIPEEMEYDFVKIRIEKSHLAELPRGSFSKVSALEFLWLNFNEITLMDMESLQGLANLTELRLQGNKLTSVPWTAFQDTPKLKILDLKHNRLDVLPDHALRHLAALTYLDLSFNKLTVMSKDVFLNWPLYQTTKKAWGKEGIVSNVVLALHDNPWLCDCRLKGFVEFIRAVSPPIILMNSYLTCSGPASQADKFFHEIQLKTCIKPVASAPQTDITLPLGANATLTCLVKARPGPTIQWMYSLKIIRGFAATETQVDEETVSSKLAIESFRHTDQGIYTCMADNFLGNSSVSLLVNLSSSNSSFPVPPAVPMLSDDDDSSRIDVRIAKQTVYGITLEWHASTGTPADAWFTVHFGKYNAPKKEMIYIGPGIHSYSIGNLHPVTKYEACVSLRSRPPGEGQCIAFVTGSDISEMEQRQRLIHVVVIVCAMVLAVPVGMFACTTEAKLGCADRCVNLWRRHRLHGQELQRMERQGTFDSLQAPSDQGLCINSEEMPKKSLRKSEDRCKGGSAAYMY